jgi:hypothetical protein
MTAVELLRATALRLEVSGWTQHVGEDRDGRCCLLGALEKEAGDQNAPYNEAYHALNAARGGWGRIALTRWNDTRGRTLSEVLELIAKAIVWIEGEAR